MLMIVWEFWFLILFSTKELLEIFFFLEVRRVWISAWDFAWVKTGRISRLKFLTTKLRTSQPSRGRVTDKLVDSVVKETN